jgi:hypothetical protein
MVGRQIAKSALIILSVWVMLALAWQSVPVSAGFTPTPQPTETPPGTPQQPGKEPKDTPTALSLTATPGLLPIAGGRVGEPGVYVVLMVGMVILVAAGVAAFRLAGTGAR